MLRRLHLFSTSARETLPVFVDFPWRYGKRTGKDHAETCQNIIAYPPSIKRRGVQDFREAFGKTCTARSEEYSPLTTAHALILFYSRSYCNRKHFNSTCSVQGTVIGCTYNRSERSLGPAVDGIPICLLTTTKFDSASTNTNGQNPTAKDSFRDRAIASLDKKRKCKKGTGGALERILKSNASSHAHVVSFYSSCAWRAGWA